MEKGRACVMATMKEVAKEAGVSLGTVSNVLNNVPTVTEVNRIKVSNAIKKLKYRPNAAARILKTNVSKSLGLVIPDITNPFYPELARGVEDAAKEYGYSVFLCNNDRNSGKEKEYIDALLEKSVDGMILVKPNLKADELKEIQQICSVVLVDADDTTGFQCDLINVDDYNGAISALDLLYRYGHTRIAFISGQLESRSSVCRQEAYFKYMKEHNIKIDKSLIIKGEYDWKSGYDCAMKLISKSNPPTAIFAANDLMAIGAMKAVKELKLNVPEDVSVIGYDDIDMASLCTPQLTTVRQPKYEAGTASVKTLLEKLKSSASEKKKNTVTVLKTEIVIRESVGYAGK